MRKFIAVKNAEEIYRLVRGEVDSVQAYIVDKDTVGTLASVFPACSFATYHDDENKLEYFQYIVTKPDEAGEMQEVGTSCIFSQGVPDGHFEAMGLLTDLVDEEGKQYFNLTKEFLVTKLPNLNLAETYPVLGVPYLRPTSAEETAIFTIPAESEEVGQTVVLFTTLMMDAEDYAVLKGTKTFKVGGLSIDIAAIVLSFNIDAAIERVCQDVHAKHALDRMSTTVVRHTTIEKSYQLANRIAQELTAPEHPAPTEAPQEIQQVAEDQDPGEAAN